MWELFWVLIYSGIFTIIIKKIPFYKLDGIPAYFILSAFYIKVLAGYLLFLIYTRYYPDRHTADIFKFFDDSKIMYDTLFTRPLDYFQMLFGIRNDNAHFNEYYHQMNNWCGIYPTNIYGDGHIMIRFNAVLRLVSFGYYNVHSVVLNFLSFSGLIGFFRFVRPYLKGVQKELFFLLFLFPSVVFWGSGVLKEGLIFFSTGLFLFTMERMIRKGFSLRLLAGLIFTLLVIRYCKFYLFAFLLPLSLSYWWCSRTGDRFSFRKYLSVIIVFILLGFLAKYVNPVYDMLSLLSHKQQDFLQLARDAGSGSLMDLPPLHSSLADIAKNLVPGFLRTLFRPFPWEISNIMMVLPALENVLLLIFILLTVYFFRKPASKPLFWFMLFFFISVFTLTGLITPVMGAMVRYRTPALPFLFASILMLWDKDRFPEWPLIVKLKNLL